MLFFNYGRLTAVFTAYGWLPLSRNFYVRTLYVRKIYIRKYYREAMNERSHVSVKVEPRSTSRLISTLYILPLFYLSD